MKLVTITICLILAIGLSAIAQTPAPAKHRAVLQMSEPQGDEWSYLLAHVQNMRIAFADDGGVEIEVVFFGPGLNMLRKTNSTHADTLNASPTRESSWQPAETRCATETSRPRICSPSPPRWTPAWPNWFASRKLAGRTSNRTSSGYRTGISSRANQY